MKVVTEVRKLLIDADISQSETAKKIGTTQANLSKKFKNNTLYSKDIEDIASALGYELKIEFLKKEN